MSKTATSLPNYSPFSPLRVWTLATNTVTQLLRMRILAFLLVFSFIAIAAGFAFPAMSPEQQLKLLKDVAFGVLQVFSIVMAVAATALLLPRDIEDRTLYTILSKPVPRYEYLIGKLLGVLLLLGGSLLVMDIIFSAIVWLKQIMIVSASLAELQHEHKDTAENMAAVKAAMERYGLTMSLHAGVFVIFLKASVVAALSLLISCLASSTLFTIIVGFAFVIAGHGEQLARDYFFHREFPGFWEKILSAVLAIVCPDLTMFDLVEPAIRGEVITLSMLGMVSGIAALYITGYMAVSYLLFVEKEL
jgi:ABC-type Na+ efflux pump permease subunit